MSFICSAEQVLDKVLKELAVYKVRFEGNATSYGYPSQHHINDFVYSASKASKMVKELSLLKMNPFPPYQPDLSCVNVKPDKHIPVLDLTHCSILLPQTPEHIFSKSPKHVSVANNETADY